MSLVNSAKAEKDVKKLAKLASNCVCPNCGCEQRHGFGAVCMKFHTFVCNNCKVSHAAVSHRCKSLTMSLWNESEVMALRNAGNDVCRATYLAHAPPPGQGGRPSSSSDIHTFKRFVVTAYERKQYYQPPSASSPSPPTQSPTPAPRAIPRRTPAPAPPAPALVAAAPLVDLLSFGGTDSAVAVQEQPLFDAFGTTSSSTVLKPPTQQQEPPQAASSSFASFPTSTTAPAAEAVFDPFNHNTTASSSQVPAMVTMTPTVATSTPTFDPFNNNTMPSSASASSLNHTTTMNGTTGLNNGIRAMNGASNNMLQNSLQNLSNSSPMVMNNNNSAMYNTNMMNTTNSPAATMMYNMNNNMMNNGMNGNPMMMMTNNNVAIMNGSNTNMLGNTMNNGQHNNMMSTGYNNNNNMMMMMNNTNNSMGGSMMGNNGILSGQQQSSMSSSFNAFGNNNNNNNNNNKASTAQSSQTNKPDPFASLFN